MRLVGINGINITGEKRKILKSLISLLENKNINVLLSSQLAKSFPNDNFKSYSLNSISKIDFIISFGGDGTLLNTVTHIGNKQVKILGVNVGKLGFLSFDVFDVFDKLIDDIINNKYTLEKRSLVSLKHNGEKINENFALNEISVIKKLAEWPRLVEIAARTNEPHRVAFYLYELASELHALWNKGNELPQLRFLQDDDPAMSQSKIALARSVAVVISAGLGILGVTPAQEMR